MKKLLLISIISILSFTVKAQTKDDVPDPGQLDLKERVDSTKLPPQEPKFTGGIDKFLDYLYQNITAAKKEHYHGTILISFGVDKNGSIIEPKIEKSNASGNINKETIRVLNESPKWAPATQFGKPVRIKYTMPINFDSSD